MDEKYLHEQELWLRGYPMVAGVDEAGRGPLAGPVVAAAVILSEGTHLPGLDDSKRLTPKKRSELSVCIRAQAVAWQVAMVDVAYIDRHNIRQATFEAMRQAINTLKIAPDYLLVDGDPIPKTKIPQSALIRGDALSASIAAASILAKVARDQAMEKWDQVYPVYGFKQHKGYPTPEHLRQLRENGPCAIHRRSYKPVKEALLRGDR